MPTSSGYDAHATLPLPRHPDLPPLRTCLQVHIVMLVAEARRQAALLYALRAVLGHVQQAVGAAR